MATDEELFGESVDGVTGFYVLPAFANEKQQASLVSKIAEAGFFAEGKANQVRMKSIQYRIATPDDVKMPCRSCYGVKMP